jgi:hypothetical protein
MIMIDINELEQLQTDISVAPPDTYIGAEVANASTLPEGYYTLAIANAESSRDRNDQPDGKAFVVTFEIMDGPYAGRLLREQRIWTKTFQRKGTTVSMLGDFLRGIDKTATWSSLADAARIIAQAEANRTPIRAKLQWEAFDYDTFKAEGGPELSREDAKLLRKKLTVRGMRNFDKAPDGSTLPRVTFTNGMQVEARVVLDRVEAQ